MPDGRVVSFVIKSDGSNSDVSLTAELVSGQLTVPIALEMALVARFYERLGDHAVNIGERIRYIAAGSL